MKSPDEDMKGTGLMTRSETVRNVIEEFDLRRAADEREYDARLAELSEKIPGFGDITHALSSVGLRILDAAMKGGDTASAVAEVQAPRDRKAARRTLRSSRKSGISAGFCGPQIQVRKMLRLRV